MFLKAYEFCTENALVLNLKTLDELEKNCASPVFSVLIEKIQKGDFVRPIERRDQPVSIENSNIQIDDANGGTKSMEHEDYDNSSSDIPKNGSDGESFASVRLNSFSDDTVESVLEVVEINGI